MASAQPSHPTSYPSSQTTSNPYAYTTSQHTQQQQPIHNRNIPFVRRLILAVVLLFIIISAVSIVSWLILHPHVPVVRITSLSISNFSLSNMQLTGKYEVEFTIANPNRKISLEFESFEVSVFYKRSPLSRAWVQPFNLRKMNQTGVKVELGTDSSHDCPIKKRTAIDMGRDWRQRVVSFNVKMAALARFKASDWLSRHRSIDVFCENLEVGFGSVNIGVGKLMSTRRRDCSVDLL